MQTIRNMFDHLHWADTRLLQQLAETGYEGPEVIRLMAHCLFAEKVWLTRLQQQDSSAISIWADSTLEECQELAERNREGYLQFLNACTDPDAICHYHNLSGVPFSTSIRDILTHVALHGQYHRGQINALLKRQDQSPVSVDYILFAREK
jgi:uncharacterized damage-inducible protein DinB